MLFFACICVLTTGILAQGQQVIVGNNYSTPNEVTLVAERGVSTTIQFDLNELNKDRMKKPAKAFKRLQMNKKTEK